MSDARRIAAIAGTALRLLFRDRANVFFVLVFPMLLILVLGTVFGSGSRPRLGVVAPAGDALAEDFVAALERAEEVEVEAFDTGSGLRTAVARGSARAGVIVPGGYGDDLRAGDSAVVGFVTRADGMGAELRTVVEAAIGDQAALQAAQFGVSETAMDFESALAAARSAEDSIAPVEVRAETVGDELFPDELGQFGQSASAQLVLFMFITGLAGSTALILSRQLGLSRRMLSTPTSSTVVLAGEALGRFLTVAFQGVYIMVGTALIFGVDWGDPVGAVALMLVFAAVASGAAMLAGATFRNEQQAAGVGIMLSLGLAALGGCMAPLQIFSPTMRAIAHVTPHAWALDGYNELVGHGGTVADILPELAVLAAMAAVLLAFGARRLRQVLTADTR
jgi:ABC-2 type transport system permease protein